MFDENNINTIFLENISLAAPEVIYVRPPEKLVIEVTGSGRYQRIVWQRNGFTLSSSTPQNPQEFFNHYEIFVRGETTEDDIGLYEVSLFLYGFLNQRLIPADIDFIVISPSESFPISLCYMNSFNTSTFS